MSYSSAKDSREGGKAVDQLPRYISAEIRRWGWTEEQIEEWLNKPIRVLGDLSILEAIQQGQLELVRRVVERMAQDWRPVLSPAKSESADPGAAGGRGDADRGATGG